MKKLIFLKLGGSVITNKDHPNSANLAVIDNIAEEIAHAQREDPELSLLIGHGSGSFGHFAAHQYGTRNGVSTPQQWRGFSEVAARARELNQIIMERLLAVGVNVLSVSPFSNVMTENHQITSWDTSVLEECLRKGLTPVIYGDVILDRVLGGTILSTEELFTWLAKKLFPASIFLAGLEQGVWEDYPRCSHLLSVIDPQDIEILKTGIQTSKSIDVTGGMKSKVEDMVALVRQMPALEVQIFSAIQPGNVYLSLMGNHIGTRISDQKG